MTAIPRPPSLSLSDRTDSSCLSVDTPDDKPLDDNQQPSTSKARPAPMVPRALPAIPAQDRRSVTAFVLAQTRLSFSVVLQNPSILRRMLLFLRWQDFRALSRSSRVYRSLLRNPELRDIILSTFVPGYGYCLEHADVTSPNFREVPLTFRDLDLFMTSRHIPLHKYPMHALTVLAALQPTQQHVLKSESSIQLSLAHSRVVLLLQSLIHSSSLPFTDEADDTHFRLRSSATSAVRELIFPAPLSYFGGAAPATTPEDPQEVPAPASVARKGAPKRRQSKLVTARRASQSKHKAALGSSAPLDSQWLQRSESKARRPRPTSVFAALTAANVRVPPPLPSEDTAGLRMYAESWRVHRREHGHAASLSEGDDFLFRRPQRRFASETLSSGSSCEDSPPPSRRTAEAPPSTTPPTISGPHDIRLATSRLRAPVLRVFHPCTALDDPAIAACEAQLDDGGLWPFLSTGDLVCNLGYLAPDDADGAGGVWLIFDGQALVPFAPARTLPLADPLSLPSPLYYMHVTPPAVNPRLALALPPAAPVFSLQLLPTDVRSPHSPRGVARTRRYAWLAHIPARVRAELGAGWQGDWVLQGDGTPEGRAMLRGALDAAAGGRRCEWELVADKTTATRLWLRCVSPALLPAERD